MHSKSFKLSCGDRQKIHVNSWVADHKPRAILLIAHGMAEHSARYQEFGRFLSQNQITVYAHDYRGHGKTAEDQKYLGFCSNQKGWQFMLEDIGYLNKYINQKHPGLPVFILGHSMGSLLVINFAYLGGKQIDGLILTGVASYQPVFTIAGLLIAAIQCRIKGKEARSYILHNMLFGGYNKHFSPARTDFDWLCTDQEVVDRYISDPYCGSVLTAGFFYNLARATLNINKTRNLDRIPKNLPVLMLAGQYDAVGNMARGVKKFYKTFQKLAIQDLNLKIYPDCRHELLNEKIKDSIYEDILTWVEGHL
ncbi:MAG: lysophospholipase [Actinomycetia bacterium]|nr:lysophospholipase [Actinomycetes bacterium]